MKNQIRSLLLVGAVAALGTTDAQLHAQDAATTPPAPDANRQRGQRGNFNMDEFRQRMMERMREQFDVKEDDAWKLISERITKVTDAQRETRGGFGGFGGGRPPGGGGDTGGGRAPSGFGGTPNPDAEALQKAIEAKASPEEIKAKLAKLRESRKAAEAKLEQAQKELVEVLTARQEAVAVMFGLLK